MTTDTASRPPGRGPRTFAYIRVSRPSEASILKNQRIAVEKHATDIHVSLVRVFDETVSGGEEERQGLGTLLRTLRPGDLVIFTSLSRMTRGGIGAAMDILRQIEKAGAGWHFTEQPMLNWDADTPKLVRDIMFAIFAAIDEDYRRRISEATRAALKRKKDAGWHGKGRKLGSKDHGPRNRRPPHLPPSRGP